VKIAHWIKPQLKLAKILRDHPLINPFTLDRKNLHY